MNNLKSYIPILFLLFILGGGAFGVYKIHSYVSSFSTRVVEISTKLQSLEDAKKDIELYRKILSKDSIEREQLDMYILKGDTVFKAITDIEKDAKRAGMLTGDNLGIMSVSKRENSELQKFASGEVLVTIEVEGEISKIDSYIEALDHLPFISHIEKINIIFSDNKFKTRANIVLVITELL